MVGIDPYGEEDWNNDENELRGYNNDNDRLIRVKRKNLINYISPAYDINIRNIFDIKDYKDKSLSIKTGKKHKKEWSDEYYKRLPDFKENEKDPEEYFRVRGREERERERERYYNEMERRRQQYIQYQRDQQLRQIDREQDNEQRRVDQEQDNEQRQADRERNLR